MLVYITSIDVKSVENQKKDVLTDVKGTVKSGFIIGPFQVSFMDEDMLVLITHSDYHMTLKLTFIVPFMTHQLNYPEAITLVKFNNCIFIPTYIIGLNYVIGFCKIYMPQADISMHILSQNDTQNEVTWIVDGINGDKIWKVNMVCELYNESGNQPFDDWFNEPYRWHENLSIGDQITIHSYTDGYYKVKFIEPVSQDILFESPLVKY